jgi:DNA-binding HxlR family transcriptional regulator
VNSSPVSRERRERTGSSTLRRLADPINGEILGFFVSGPVRPPGESAGEAVPEPRAVGKAEDLPENADSKYRLTPSGLEAAAVCELLKGWLAKCPAGGLPYGGDGAPEAMEALVDSWDSTVLHALAAEPHSLTELVNAVEGVEPATIERLLESMQMLGLLQRRAGDHGKVIYGVTEWLREGIGPLSAAARLERRHLAATTAPATGPDVIAAFQLALPLIHLDSERSGTCRVSIQLGAGAEAGATATIEAGQVTGCASDLEGDADASATGDLRDWFRAVIDGGVKRLDMDGDRDLARAVVAGLHEALFGNQP